MSMVKNVVRNIAQYIRFLGDTQGYFYSLSPPISLRAINKEKELFYSKIDMQ